MRFNSSKTKEIKFIKCECTTKVKSLSTNWEVIDEEMIIYNYWKNCKEELKYN